MRGKEKCKALKEIRKQIAETNDIPFIVSECQHQGDCKGTCPKCESELRYLERELAFRQGLGRAVAVVGISVGACSALTACSPQGLINKIENIGYDELAGDVAPVELDGEIIETPTELNDIEGKMVAPEETTSPELAGDIAVMEESK